MRTAPSRNPVYEFTDVATGRKFFKRIGDPDFIEFTTASGVDQGRPRYILREFPLVQDEINYLKMVWFLIRLKWSCRFERIFRHFKSGKSIQKSC